MSVVNTATPVGTAERSLGIHMAVRGHAADQRADQVEELHDRAGPAVEQ
jgi:hypothetical protein